MSYYIDIVADYGKNDLAFAEVQRKIHEEFDKLNLDIKHMNYISTNPFNTVETGFKIAQLALNSNMKNHIIYHNCAPRKDDINARQDNDGEFLAATFINNVFVIGVNSGYSFSYLDNAEIYKVKCESKGSQFRSRDIFPQALATLSRNFNPLQVNGLEFAINMFDGKINVPAYENNKILYIDGYGNIKTSIVLTEEQKAKEWLDIKIGNRTEMVLHKEGIFSVPDGSLVLAPGSSGWNNKRFYEISLRGGSASLQFGYPLPGDTIEIQ